MKRKNAEVDIDETLRSLEEIAAWFEEQKESNLEEGLKKVEEAAKLLDSGRKRLGEIENRFEEVKGRIS